MLVDLHTGAPLLLRSPTPAFCIGRGAATAMTTADARRVVGAVIRPQTPEHIEHEAVHEIGSRIFVRVGAAFHQVIAVKVNDGTAAKKPRKAPAAPTSLSFDFEARSAAPSGAAQHSLPVYVERPPKKVLSYGGGLDSFAMLIDAVQRGEKPDLVIFADVTDRNRIDPGEWPETYSHIERVAIPYCNKHGIRFVWLHTDESPIRGARSLYAYLRSLNTMVGRASRLCTCAAKVDRISAWVGREFPNQTIEMWIGFEAGEESRAAKDPHAVEFRRDKKGNLVRVRAKSSVRRISRFPLIERGICRDRAAALVKAAGLEMPPGSACVYCPFSTKGDFQRLAHQIPSQFVAVETLERSAKLTKKGYTIRFGGGAKAPPVGEWAAKKYTALKMRCPVCGAYPRLRKNVGCSTEELDKITCDL